ncbi:hypothetical protein K3495_g2186 [Podosphaera aphanis]|nr:hypothetical protein K3495_g2186 [Podosphaera aphanis]
MDQLLKVKGIVFDLDGTLCLPQNSMFKEMRSALGITKEVDILDHCYALPPAKQEEEFQKIRDIELTAMKDQVPQPGVVQLMKFLEVQKLQKAICTRNFDGPAQHFISKFLPGLTISPVITRSFRPPKPDPAGILHIATFWGLTSHDATGQPIPDATGLIMVGDSLDDMTAGRRAGTVTVLLQNDENSHLVNHDDCDLGISRIDELIKILEEGLVVG